MLSLAALVIGAFSDRESVGLQLLYDFPRLQCELGRFTPSAGNGSLYAGDLVREPPTASRCLGGVGVGMSADRTTAALTSERTAEPLLPPPSAPVPPTSAYRHGPRVSSNSYPTLTLALTLTVTLTRTQTLTLTLIQASSLSATAWARLPPACPTRGTARRPAPGTAGRGRSRARGHSRRPLSRGAGRSPGRS